MKRPFEALPHELDLQSSQKIYQTFKALPNDSVSESQERTGISKLPEGIATQRLCHVAKHKSSAK
jgi:hypothetical protein